ncbi:MAG: sterol desaturase family protein [Alphaproteobacteria bacterium]|nr:sterol desaturase family protein [Alphaproteobacteria bacterium]
MLRTAMSYVLWPLLFGLCVAAVAVGMARGGEDGAKIAFCLAYAGLALAVGVLERVLPHERSWLEPDGQTFANIAHTVLNKGAVGLLIFGILALKTALMGDTAPEATLWPDDWPMWVQVPLGLAIAELGLYWAHRLAHEWAVLWPYHAVHHSVTRLWFVNTGRFHFVDTAVSVVLSQPILWLMGAPAAILLWVSAVTAFIGILTHCNIEMRFGPVSWIFNTPGLHRWHHSTALEEGNTNYGENLMLWDHAFRTFYNPDRRPPAKIGILTPMPETFLGQLAYPFRERRVPPAPAEAG